MKPDERQMAALTVYSALRDMLRAEEDREGMRYCSPDGEYTEKFFEGMLLGLHSYCVWLGVLDENDDTLTMLALFTRLAFQIGRDAERKEDEGEEGAGC